MLEMLKKVTSITKLNHNGEFPAFGSIFNYPTILLVHLLDHYRVFVKWYYNKHTEWYFIYSYMHVPWWRFYHYFNNRATTLHVHVYIYIDSLDVSNWPLKKPVHLAKNKEFLHLDSFVILWDFTVLQIVIYIFN